MEVKTIKSSSAEMLAQKVSQEYKKGWVVIGDKTFVNGWWSVELGYNSISELLVKRYSEQEFNFLKEKALIYLKNNL